MLHSKFVVVPIDKASSHVALVCLRHYAQVLNSELGLNVNNITTYKKAIKPVDKILSDNTSFLKSRFDFEVDEINKKLGNK